MNKRVIAIHLPQFYPFKENDEWWGKGFTEWTNVANSQPRFRGHYQPHIPKDLGFYDLRLPESRLAQESMAKEYGIYGFCYYHYWFNGHLIMEKPVEAKLQNQNEDLPFMLCWANEDWNRNWAGHFNKTLIKQDYSLDDDEKHFNYLLKFFKDPRYIRVDNKPVFCIYRPALFPDFDKTIALWQRLALKEGFQLYICKFEAGREWGSKFMPKSADAAVEFQPINKEGWDRKYTLLNKITNKIFNRQIINRNIFSYKDYVDFQLSKPIFNKYKRYPSVCPSWDNSSRRKKQPFACFVGATPDLFKKWFEHVYNNFVPFSEEENFIFINAWNEWAEGCHLEPDLKYGTGFLEAIKSVVEKVDN
jgi:hypothetical protein